MSTTSLVFPICSSYIDDKKVGYTFLYLATMNKIFKKRIDKNSANINKANYYLSLKSLNYKADHRSQ